MSGELPQLLSHCCTSGVEDSLGSTVAFSYASFCTRCLDSLESIIYFLVSVFSYCIHEVLL
jgi:hypothetical protein